MDQLHSELTNKKTHESQHIFAKGLFLNGEYLKAIYYLEDLSKDCKRIYGEMDQRTGTLYLSLANAYGKQGT